MRPRVWRGFPLMHLCPCPISHYVCQTSTLQVAIRCNFLPRNMLIKLVYFVFATCQMIFYLKHHSHFSTHSVIVGACNTATLHKNNWQHVANVATERTQR